MTALKRICFHTLNALWQHNAEQKAIGTGFRCVQRIRSNCHDRSSAQFRRNFQHVGDFWLVKEAGTAEQNRAARRKLVVKQAIRIEDIRRFVAIPVIFGDSLGVLRSSLKMNLRVTKSACRTRWNPSVLTPWTGSTRAIFPRWRR